MKTKYEYEASDIKVKDFAQGETMDPVHSFLMGQVMIILIKGMKAGEDGDDGAGAMLQIQAHIANFLNEAQESGIVIAKGEAIPAAFRVVS